MDMNDTQTCENLDLGRATEPPVSACRPRRNPDLPSSSLIENAAARRIIDVLLARGVTTFFGIPGGPVCPLFEAIRLTPGARLVESRHESHAAFSAVGYYRATGEVPAIVVTAGPGITNSVTGVASAYMEGVPMVVLTGDVAWAAQGGRLAQNCGPEGLNVEHLMTPITRAQIRLVHPRAAVSQTQAAFNAATDALEPGPVLLVVPLDLATAPAPGVSIAECTPSRTLRARPQVVERTAQWLADARRPLVVLGGGCRPHAHWIRQLLDVLNVPFMTTPRAKGVVSEHHPRSLRNGGMGASMWARRYTSEGPDVALVLGSDLDDTSMASTPCIGFDGRLIHVDLDASVFNRNLPTALGVHADLGHFALDLYNAVLRTERRNPHGSTLMAEARAVSPFDVPDFDCEASQPIAPHRVIADLERAVGPDARFVTDIGEHMLFALHYLTAGNKDSFHIQLNLGSMGSGIAGAVGLALGDPSRPVVCVCGDGGMQMAGMEVLTAIKERLPIVYAVFNDARYNMVHHGMKQIFTEADTYESAPVDFQAWAHSMGVSAATITRSGEIDSALVQDLLASGGPALLDIRVDKELRLRGGGRVEALQQMSMLARAAGEEF